VRVFFAAVIIGLIGLVQPSRAEACGCLGTVSSAAAFEAADFVFVGVVARVDTSGPWHRANPDGSISGGTGLGPPIASLAVTHMFRGGRREAIVLTGTGSTCDHPFQPGESWLVYANWEAGGAVTTHKCTRTRLQADASQDLVYLTGVEEGRQQGIVYGEAVPWADGRSRAAFMPLQVIAAGGGQRFETTTDRWGPYQIVLPPGKFEIWVERAGRIVGSKQTVQVKDGMIRHLRLVVQYRD